MKAENQATSLFYNSVFNKQRVMWYLNRIVNYYLASLGFNLYTFKNSKRVLPTETFARLKVLKNSVLPGRFRVERSEYLKI